MLETKKTDPKTLQHILDGMKDIPILVIGDIMLDRFVYGAVERISPESPVPVLSVSREDTMLGGAGNALASVHGLKAKVHILSIIGQDAEGAALTNTIENLGVMAQDLLVDETRPTTVKTRFLAGHQQLLRTDFEDKTPINSALEDKVIKRALEIIPQVKAVLISDYGKGLLTQTVLRKVIDAAKAQNVPVVVDPKGYDYSIYAGASAVTPNKKELSDATNGSDTRTDHDVIMASKTLIESCDVECIIATRSQDGMSIIEKGSEDEATHLRTTALEVFDVSGAGDVVIATITAALASGASMVQAGAIANIAGGIAVAKVGTTPIRIKELKDALADASSGHNAQSSSEVSAAARMLHAPLCDWDEAQEQVHRWRARGLKVGFTNGCFDIVHHGHVSYLAEARSHCDRLIVAVNKDSSVKALKGPERPVHEETARASVLGALGSVDMVVLFGGQSAADDQTANAIIARLQPDIYFKGGDYEVDEIPETSGVKAYGGTVNVLSVFEGHSTTSSIEKMRTQAA